MSKENDEHTAWIRSMDLQTQREVDDRKLAYGQSLILCQDSVLSAASLVDAVEAATVNRTAYLSALKDQESWEKRKIRNGW